MIRLHLSAQDLSRTTLASDASWAAETVASLRVLGESPTPAGYRQWRCDVRSRLDDRVRFLLGMVPLRGYTPTFFAPDHCDAREAIAQQSAIDSDLRELSEHRELSPMERGLMNGERRLIYRLACATNGYRQAALIPYWEHIRSRVDADRATRVAAFAVGGLGGILTTLHPTVSWRPPTVAIETTADLDVTLRGSGLLLQPSVFASSVLVCDYNEDRPVLVYPAIGGGRIDGRTVDADRHLRTLFGPTRWAILEATSRSTGCRTSELARALSVSPSAVSQHLAVLRKVGLVSSHRQGQSVVHVATDQGLALLAVERTRRHRASS